MSIKGYATNLMDMRPGQKLSFALAFLSMALYVQIAFFTVRSNGFLLLGSYTLLFLTYLMLTKSILSFRFLMAFGILFRLVLVFSIPNLSDDFYRFFWDGVLIKNQINPFLYIPREIIENPSIIIPALDIELFASLNSPDYYTVYPPVCQFIFWMAATFGNGNLRLAVLIMKLFIFLAEIGSIHFMLKLLKIHQLRREYIYFYVFNPLIIIELVGNIHFEALMIFFVLWGTYLIQKNQLAASSIAFALAIASKLTPLLLLPFFLKRFKLSKALIYYGLTLLFAAITFLPFVGSPLINGLSSSLGLYFQKFEFNASIFYIIRQIGLWMVGWDIIQVASIWLSLSTVLIILFLVFFENTKSQNLPGIFIWPLFAYFALASIIHPWYATPLVAFCWFSNYRFPLVWSFTIFLSYAGYTPDGFQEQLWVLIVQYLLVYSVMIYELISYKDLVVIKNPWPEILSSTK